MNSPEEKIKQSLRFSFLDGVFASAMSGFTQEYFTPFLLFLGGTARHVGMLSAFPNLFASLVQLKTADLTERLKSRKKIINIFVPLQALMLLPLAMLALFEIAKPMTFIIIVVMFATFGAIATPAWGSLMSELVSEKERGIYFGWRNRTLGFVAVGATFIAGFLLHIMKKINIAHGFFVIFILALVFRIISWGFLKKLYEPQFTSKKENYFSLLNFLLRLRKSNFAQFVLFASALNFSVNLASPFFAVLMLKELHFGYFLYTIITLSATLTVYLTMRRWGRHADKIGNLKVIRFTAPLIGVIPLLWIINRHPLFLIAAQVFSGFVWAGFTLCTTNFIYDAVSPEKRTRCIAYFNVINGLTLCAGSLSGAFLLSRLAAFSGYKILTLFLLSAILRIIVGILGPLRLKEVRPVESVNSNELFFSMMGIRPISGVERKTIRY